MSALSFDVDEGQIRLRKGSLRLPQLPHPLPFDDLSIELGPTHFAFDNALHGELGPTNITVVLAEVTLNTILEQFVPSNAPVADLSLRLLSNKVIAEGRFLPAKIKLPFSFLSVPIPFTAEVIPTLPSPTQIYLELKTVRTGFPLPEIAIHKIEQMLNELLGLNLQNLPIPLTLQEIRCEPGRLTVHAHTQLKWPLPAPSVPLVPAPFSAKPLLDPS